MSKSRYVAGAALLTLGVLGYATLAGSDVEAIFGSAASRATRHDANIARHAERSLIEGRKTFRFDTFGDEAFWGDALKLHQSIQGARFGGVGPGLSPKSALELGLKVDVEALSRPIVDALRQGQVNLDDPATTLVLLREDAVVGVKGLFNENGTLRSVGITCALCHSTVDNSVAQGIGRRLDGWANRDLNVGAIISFAPDLSSVAALLETTEPTVRAVVNAWGPGKFDAQLFLDGKAFRPDGKTAATLIPPALHFYQLAIPAPRPPKDSFDEGAAKRGKELFSSRAKCITCHVPPIFTEPGWNMHTPEEIGIDDFQANRSPDRRYRTAPLKGLWTHQKGGFYHDGRFATLRHVVEHYNNTFGLRLVESEVADIVQYLKSL